MLELPPPPKFGIDSSAISFIDHQQTFAKPNLTLRLPDLVGLHEDAHRLAEHYFSMERFIRLEGLDEVPPEVLKAVVHAMGLADIPLRIELEPSSSESLEDFFKCSYLERISFYRLSLERVLAGKIQAINEFCTLLKAYPRRLSRLSLNRNRFNPKEMKKIHNLLQNLPLLENLDLSYCITEQEYSQQFVVGLKEVFKNVHSIQYLDISGNCLSVGDINHVFMYILKSNHAILDLDISNNKSYYSPEPISQSRQIMEKTENSAEQLSVNAGPQLHPQSLCELAEKAVSHIRVCLHYTHIGKPALIELLKSAQSARFRPCWFLAAYSYDIVSEGFITMKELVEDPCKPDGFKLYGNFELTLGYFSKSTLFNFQKFVDFNDLDAANNRIAFIEATYIVRQARDNHVLKDYIYTRPFKSSSSVTSPVKGLSFAKENVQGSEIKGLHALFWNYPLLAALASHLTEVKISDQNLTQFEVPGICYLLSSQASLKEVDLSRNSFTVLDVNSILQAASQSQVEYLKLKKTMSSGQAILPLHFNSSFKELEIESKFLYLKTLLNNTEPAWRANHVFRTLLYEEKAFKPDDPLHFFESARALEQLLKYRYRWKQDETSRYRYTSQIFIEDTTTTAPFFADQQEPYTSLLVMNFSNHVGQAGPILVDLLLFQNRLQYLILANQNYTNENLKVFFKAIHESPSQISYIDLRGNELGSSPEFTKLLAYFPKTLDTLVLAGNNLRNYDLRQLSCTIKIRKVIDIRDNAYLTLGASKTFPIFYLKSNRNVKILHTLNWQDDANYAQRRPGCINKIKDFLYKRSIRFRFHEQVIDRIEKSFPFTFCLALVILICYFIFLGSIFFMSIYMNKEACENGHFWLAHGLFGGLLFLLFLIELILLLKIKQRLPYVESIKHKGQYRSIFPLSRFKLLWKLGSSALARADLYTDLLFIVILFDCGSKPEHNLDILIGVCLTSIILSLLFPFLLLLYIFFSSARCRCFKPSRVQFKRLERLARLSYIADFKAMGAVFGSFCVDLKIRCGNFERSVPRLYAVYRLILEDVVQCVCQLIFLSSQASQLFVMVSIALTIFNFFVSLFNIFITSGAKPSRQLFQKFVGHTEHYQYFQSQITYRLRQRNVNLTRRIPSTPGTPPNGFLSPKYMPAQEGFNSQAAAVTSSEVKLVLNIRESSQYPE